jgi:hypothetical protein
MFLQSYFWSSSFGDAAVLARLWLIAAMRLYLTDFLTRVFSGKIAKNHAFCGKMQRAAPPFTIPFFTMSGACGN